MNIVNCPFVQSSQKETDERRVDCLWRSQTEFQAGMEWDNLVFYSPATKAPAAGIYFHTVMVEFQRVLHGYIVDNPTCRLEEALQHVEKHLACRGFSCPLKMQCRVLRNGKKLCSPAVSCATTLLAMRSEAMQASSSALAGLRQKWVRQSRELAQQNAALSKKRCAQLWGFLYAQLQTLRSVPLVRRRKCCKQPEDVVVQVALDSSFCQTLGSPDELARRLGTRTGNDFLCTFLLHDVANDPASPNHEFAAGAWQWLESKRRRYEHLDRRIKQRLDACWELVLVGGQFLEGISGLGMQAQTHGAHVLLQSSTTASASSTCFPRHAFAGSCPSPSFPDVSVRFCCSTLIPKPPPKF